jgi:hypothetical protein
MIHPSLNTFHSSFADMCEQAFEQEQLEDLEGVLWKSYFA